MPDASYYHEQDRLKRDKHAYFGLPKPSDLNRPGVLGLTMDSLLALDHAIDTAHRTLVREGVLKRYQHALDLSNNPEAFAAWIKEPRICSLPRPPKRPEETCRALFRATYENPKEASKRFKRIEPAWKRGDSVETVAAFLFSRGLQDKKSSTETQETEGDVVSQSGGNIERAHGECEEHAAKMSPSKPKQMRIVNAPRLLTAAKKVGDAVCLCGRISSIEDGDLVMVETFYG